MFGLADPMRITNAFPNGLNKFPVDNQSYKVNNVKYKKTNVSLMAKLSRLYLKPKQEL